MRTRASETLKMCKQKFRTRGCLIFRIENETLNQRFLSREQPPNIWVITTSKRLLFTWHLGHWTMTLLLPNQIIWKYMFRISAYILYSYKFISSSITKYFPKDNIQKQQSIITCHKNIHTITRKLIWFAEGKKKRHQDSLGSFNLDL
jgi:hypothetical protein